MVDLVQWLTAQLDADAEANASPYAEGAWHTRGCASIPDVFGQETSECDCGVPSRVLREIDVKRQMLAEYEQAARYAKTTWGQSNADQSRAQTLGKVVRLLAAPYSDRPGFREEWAP
jgi:hypothetical protein